MRQAGGRWCGGGAWLTHQPSYSAMYSARWQFMPDGTTYLKAKQHNRQSNMRRGTRRHTARRNRTQNNTAKCADELRLVCLFVCLFAAYTRSSISAHSCSFIAYLRVIHTAE